MVEYQDCAGFEDSDVFLEGHIGSVGPVNSLLPRFEHDTEDETTATPEESER